MSEEYRARLGTWLNTIRKDYADRIPEGFPLDFVNYDLPDDTLQKYALGLQSAINNRKSAHSAPVAQEAAHGSKLMYIVPVQGADGSVTFLDQYSGKVVAGSYRLNSGLFSYYGTKDTLEVLFGRGGLSAMWQRTEDNDFFHDAKK
jgi:hypothetical protein